jgi:SpoVK/Ycf46/Vps4 family AAA+-type ATPase
MQPKKAKGLEAFAQRLNVTATWDRLGLPRDELAVLRQMVDEMKSRQVGGKPGFSGPALGRSGVVALLAGPSGTGKTMAAEVLAKDLRRDLFRVDLSAVRSKYIGETEKNLARLFDEAERAQAILFFDEADALFGKRSEVKDAHDRYANMDVAYLLQRMESFNGLTILATDSTAGIDEAFLRRLRYIVKLP